MSRPLLNLKIIGSPGTFSRRPILDATSYNAYCLGDNLPPDAFTARISTLQKLVFDFYPTRCRILHRTMLFFALITGNFLALVAVLLCARSISLAIELLIPQLALIIWILFLRHDSSQKLGAFASKSSDLVKELNKVDTPRYGIRWAVKKSSGWHPFTFELWQVDLEAADYDLPAYQEYPGAGTLVVAFEAQPPGYEEFLGSSAASLEGREEGLDNEADVGEMGLRQAR